MILILDIRMLEQHAEARRELLGELYGAVARRNILRLRMADLILDVIHVDEEQDGNWCSPRRQKLVFDEGLMNKKLLRKSFIEILGVVALWLASAGVF